MTKTFEQLDQLATACMESENPEAVSYHRKAAEEHARADDPSRSRPGSPCQAWARRAEADHLLTALIFSLEKTIDESRIQLAEPSPTTAELLLTAAIIAARAEGEELPRAAAALDVGDLAALSRAVELARQFVDDWQEDAKNLDELERGSLASAELEIAQAERIVAALPAPQLAGEELPDNRCKSDDEPLPFDVDCEGMNSKRADWAGAALAEFQEQTGTDDGDAISDLVCDLLHLCDREGDRYGRSALKQIKRGLYAYESEITDTDPEEELEELLDKAEQRLATQGR